jgi:hypothetical protein
MDKYSIGFDLDNTIAIYDDVFKILNDEYNLQLNPDEINKRTFKLKIIEKYSENEWTKIQGRVYGNLMKFAKPAENFLEVLSILQEKKYKIQIISHRTKKSTCGANHNLQDYAYEWINRNLKLEIGAPLEINFLETEDEKINAINKSMVNFFVDDLEKILINSKLKPEIKKILYGPKISKNSLLVNIDGWDKFLQILE